MSRVKKPLLFYQKALKLPPVNLCWDNPGGISTRSHTHLIEHLIRTRHSLPHARLGKRRDKLITRATKAKLRIIRMYLIILNCIIQCLYQALTIPHFYSREIKREIHLLAKIYSPPYDFRPKHICFTHIRIWYRPKLLYYGFSLIDPLWRYRNRISRNRINDLPYQSFPRHWR